MAFNPAPNTWIADWSEDETDISVPIASFPELTAAEADGATGDIRKIVWAITEKLYQEFNSRAAADRPKKWTMSKSASVNSTTGVITNTITMTFLNSILTQDVVAE
jgi:hypothetical protein